jgi:hypothetical protein
MASRGGSASVPRRGARSGGRNRAADSTSATAGQDGPVFAGSKRSRPAGGAARVQTPAPASQPPQAAKKARKASAKRAELAALAAEQRAVREGAGPAELARQKGVPAAPDALPADGSAGFVDRVKAAARAHRAGRETTIEPWVDFTVPLKRTTAKADSPALVAVVMGAARSSLKRLREQRSEPLEPWIDVFKPLAKAKKKPAAAEKPAVVRLPPSAAEATAGPLAVLQLLRKVAAALPKYEAVLRPLLGEPTLAALAFAAEARRVLHEAYGVGSKYPPKQADHACLVVSVLARGSETRRRLQKLLATMHSEAPPGEQLRLGFYWLWRNVYAEFRRVNAAELPPTVIEEMPAHLSADDRPVCRAWRAWRLRPAH